jgi:hypothetical protein
MVMITWVDHPVSVAQPAILARQGAGFPKGRVGLTVFHLTLPRKSILQFAINATVLIVFTATTPQAVMIAIDEGRSQG